MLTPITLFTHELLGAAVVGRELYQLIAKADAKRDSFSDWALDRIRRFELASEVDYVRQDVKLPQFAKRTAGYCFSVKAAIQIALFQPAKRGRGVVAFLEAYQLNPAIAEPVVPTDQPARIEQTGSSPVTEQPLLPVCKPGSPMERVLADIQHLSAEVQQLIDSEGLPVDQAETIARLESRLQLAEARTEIVLSAFEQVVVALRGLNGVGTETPEAETPIQGKVIRLVNAYAAATQKNERDIWRLLYGQFTIRTGFDPYAVTNRQGRSYLSVIEQRGKIDALHELAQKIFVLPELSQ